VFSQRVEIDGRYWVTSADNRIRFGSELANPEISFQRDLGMADKNAPDVRFAFRSRGHSRLVFGYTHLDWDGDRNVSRTIEFDNRLYPAETRVVSSLKLDYLKLGWAYMFGPRGEDAKFRMGPLVEASGIFYDAALSAPGLSLSAADRRKVGFPSVGFVFDARPHSRVSIYGEASGISAGDYGYFVGAEGGLKVQPVRHLNVEVGYRSLRIDPKFEPDYGRLNVRGPFFGAGITF
jgi:hypothetical protein